MVFRRKESPAEQLSQPLHCVRLSNRRRFSSQIDLKRLNDKLDLPDPSQPELHMEIGLVLRRNFFIDLFFQLPDLHPAFGAERPGIDERADHLKKLLSQAKVSSDRPDLHERQSLPGLASASIIALV